MNLRAIDLLLHHVPGTYDGASQAARLQARVICAAYYRKEAKR